jgi:hypothetical protein
MVCKSSGTTNDKSKFIPVSNDSLYKCHFKAPVDIFALYVRNNPENNILQGKNLTIGGSQKVSNLSKKTRTGDLSAVMISNLPMISRLKNTPPSEISLIPDFDEKIDKIVRATVNENITSLSGVPSWFSRLIKIVFLLYWERYFTLKLANHLKLLSTEAIRSYSRACKKKD